MLQSPPPIVSSFDENSIRDLHYYFIICCLSLTNVFNKLRRSYRCLNQVPFSVNEFDYSSDSRSFSTPDHNVRLCSSPVQASVAELLNG